MLNDLKDFSNVTPALEEQNIFTSKENHQLRQKISELKLQLEILQTTSSSSLLSTKEEPE